MLCRPFAVFFFISCDIYFSCLEYCSFYYVYQIFNYYFQLLGVYLMLNIILGLNKVEIMFLFLLLPIFLPLLQLLPLLLPLPFPCPYRTVASPTSPAS